VRKKYSSSRWNLLATSSADLINPLILHVIVEKSVFRLFSFLHWLFSFGLPKSRIFRDVVREVRASPFQTPNSPYDPTLFPKPQSLRSRDNCGTRFCWISAPSVGATLKLRHYFVQQQIFRMRAVKCALLATLLLMFCLCFSFLRRHCAELILINRSIDARSDLDPIIYYYGNNGVLVFIARKYIKNIVAC